jgi:hypothetical protein
LADGRAHEKRDGPRYPLLPILHHNLDPVVDGLCAPLQSLADFEVHIHDLARSFKDMAILDFKQILERADELLGLGDKIKNLHDRNEH